MCFPARWLKSDDGLPAFHKQDWRNAVDANRWLLDVGGGIGEKVWGGRTETAPLRGSAWRSRNVIATARSHLSKPERLRWENHPQVKRRLTACHPRSPSSWRRSARSCYNTAHGQRGRRAALNIVHLKQESPSVQRLWLLQIKTSFIFCRWRKVSDKTATANAEFLITARPTLGPGHGGRVFWY